MLCFLKKKQEAVREKNVKPDRDEETAKINAELSKQKIDKSQTKSKKKISSLKKKINEIGKLLARFTKKMEERIKLLNRE